MKNFIQPGANIDFTAGAAYTSGQGLKIEDLFGVVAGDVASGDKGVLVTEGVFELPKRAAAAMNQGAKVDWDEAVPEVVPNGDAASDIVIGVVAVAALAADTTVKVRLIPGIS